MDNNRVNTRRVAVRAGLTAWNCREGDGMGAPGLQAGSRRWEVPLASGSPQLTANELVRTEDRGGRNGGNRWGEARSGIQAGGVSRRTGRKGPRRRRAAAGKSAPPAGLSWSRSGRRHLRPPRGAAGRRRPERTAREQARNSGPRPGLPAAFLAASERRGPARPEAPPASGPTPCPLGPLQAPRTCRPPLPRPAGPATSLRL
nr:oleosin-B6-like [Macaca fascicularis]